MFKMMYADERGRLYDHPALNLVGRTGDRYTEPLDNEMILLPEGASLTLLPGRSPVGMAAASTAGKPGKLTPLRETVPLGAANRDRTSQAFPVGALLPQGYTRTLLPAFYCPPGENPSPLPLLGYAAVGFRDGRIYTAAVPTDDNEKWHPKHYNTKDLPDLVRQKQEEFPGNRIIAQLSRCALDYACFTAQNIFYRRWEGGIPVSPACNARCIGCISLQPAECCPAPQNRIGFRPTTAEITEIAAAHLKAGLDAIVSFGQGCEGEPAMAADTVAAAIREIRRQTDRGTVNINTNAGHTAGIKQLAAAGLDAVRVSMISPREHIYNAYYRPEYRLDDMFNSIGAAKSAGLFISVNLLTLPGLTDRAAEVGAWVEFFHQYQVDMVQFRNLNIDPDYLWRMLPVEEDEILGITTFIDILKEELPNLIIGNFTHPVR
jgi:pyruvate-formate lyase-activating enzyme